MSSNIQHEETIPTQNYLLMPWLANYETEITGFMTGGLAPDGEPYFYNRAHLRWNNVVVPALTALQGKWNPTWGKKVPSSPQGKAFTNAKEAFLKNTFRPFNKEFVLYNSALTVENRTTIGVIPAVSKTKSAATVLGDRLAPVQLALKKQLHLGMEIEVEYPGTKSKKKRTGVKEVMLFMMTQAASNTTLPDLDTGTYKYIGDMVRGVHTQVFPITQEGQAALFIMREKNTKGVMGNPTGVLRIVIA
ncbi:MAG TPA: hypothetical protein VF411_02720 [Bacteroidia bacterium]